MLSSAEGSPQLGYAELAVQGSTGIANAVAVTLPSLDDGMQLQVTLSNLMAAMQGQSASSAHHVAIATPIRQAAPAVPVMPDFAAIETKRQAEEMMQQARDDEIACERWFSGAGTLVYGSFAGRGAMRHLQGAC